MQTIDPAAQATSPSLGHNLPETDIVAAYCKKTKGSEALAKAAAECFPSGVTHDSRYLRPHGLYVEHAAGPHKWDVDGNRYIDYYGGHGALLLGHNRAEVKAAIDQAMTKGTHFGAGHPAEIAWAGLVKQLVPCAERVRFTSSGTEANSMAVRLARGFTGRSKVLRFRGQFHGWQDEASIGYANHFDGTSTLGVPPSAAGNIVLSEVNDLTGLRRILETDDDIAVIMVEAMGAMTGKVPLEPGFHQGLRELCDAFGCVLLFDEVVTGFRVSPGGMQAHTGVTPDLTSLAKILAGGLPGGAVVGRKDILDQLDFKVAAEAKREKIHHPGTFNANPVSAAAGAETLRIIGSSPVCEEANALGEDLRRGLNDVLKEKNVEWTAYGSASVVHLCLHTGQAEFDPLTMGRTGLQNKDPELVRQLRLAMLINGVDMAPTPGAVVSASHTSNDVEDTCRAFSDSLHALQQAHLL
ncbi:MAG: aminotransferase class III-fold pyridoxal phosphate-dependent enzyme [Pseudomonadota bacterium]